MAFRPLTAPTTTAPSPSSPSGGFRPLTPPSTSTPTATNEGLFSRIKTGVTQSFNERTKQAEEAKRKALKGEQSHVSGALQTTGQVAGIVADTGFTVAKEAVRSVAPSVIPAVKKTIGAVMQTKPAQAATQAYSDVKEKYPTAIANIEAVGNIASVVPTAKAGQIGAKLAGKSVAKGTDLAVKGAEKVGTAAKDAPSRVASVLSNVPKEDFEFAADPKYTPLVEKALTHVGENEKQPFFEVANRTALGINKAEEDAAKVLQQAKLDFKSGEPNASFDVRPYKHELASQLQTFKEYGLELRGDKNFKLAKTAQSPFEARELDALNALLAKINASDDLDVDNLLALSKSLNAAYDAVPLGVNGTPRPYHAVLMSIKAPTEKFIDNILPPALRTAFDRYRLVQEMKSEIGNKLIDGQGNVKDTAEQFLSNLGNINKGNVRLNADQLRALTGIDINSEVRAVKVAQKFSNVFPTTGSRTQDVIRSILASGAGSMALGPIGMGLGIAATSPKLLGKAAIKIGKSRAEGGTVQRMGDYLKDVQPGLSTKDVTQDKLDTIKDLLIGELNKPGKTLNLDIEEEAENFIDMLRDTKAINSIDVNRAMEILRLQGKTDIIEKLRRELGASTDQPRDKMGRWRKTVGSALKR